MTNYDSLYKKNYYGEKLFENHFSKKELGFQIIENGTILPYKPLENSVGLGGIVDAEGNFIKESFIHRGAGNSYTPDRKVKYSPKTVIYLGMLVHVWGHCLTDNIKRIWFLKSNFFKENFKNCQIVYVKAGVGIIPNFARLLKILGVEVEDFLEIEKPTRFKKIILPDESFFLDKGSAENYDCAIEGSRNNFNGNDTAFFTQEYIQTIEQIRNFAQKNFSPLTQKKFFFYYGGNQTGEGRLADYFSEKGYEMIEPEKFSLDEQLNILANCENFASVIGSISHNILFLKNHSQAILIPRRPAFLNIYQQAIDQVHDLEIFYIDSAFSIFARSQSGTFCYILSEQLRKFFGDEITEKFSQEDFYHFLTYSKFAKENNWSINPQDDKYFSDLILEFMTSLKNNSNFLKK
ncbi:MAG: glycosyltransferase family 61 protein [Selenomonadaceae bacterium]|nr:glycosyltransferase family 61 protein [Selenomonadaceae bacterium]